jgi:hypothetical protein
MLNNIFQQWNDPNSATYIYVIWTIVVILLGIYFNIFTKEFIRFGPAKKGQKPVTFMGREIHTKKGIIFIMVYSFINQLITTYNINIISPWRLNIIQDSKTTVIDMTKNNLFWLLNLDNFFGWISYILNLGMVLSMELQFIIPKILASIIVENISTFRYVAEKTFL